MRVMESGSGTERAIETPASGRPAAGKVVRLAGVVATGLFAAIMTASGIAFVLGPPPVIQGIGHLGYPRYFILLLGVAKLLGVGALLAPRARALREWAYAGFTFLLVAAVLSHTLSGDAPAHAAPAAFAMALLLTSYFARRRAAERDARPHPVLEASDVGGRFWRVAPWVSRAVLLPPTVIFALIAFRYLSNPVAAAAAVGTSLATPEAITVARVASGAFPLSFSLFLGASVVSGRRLLAALALATTFIAIATLVRAFGIVAEGAGGESLKLLRSEIALLLVSAAGLVLEWRRRQRALRA